jgi:hypothetical protein
MNDIEWAGMGLGSLWVGLLAAIVVGVICCALTYVSTFLGISATAGIFSQLSGPIDADIVYPDAEATLRPAETAPVV